jgi:hypothetical protein
MPVWAARGDRILQRYTVAPHCAAMSKRFRPGGARPGPCARTRRRKTILKSALLLGAGIAIGAGAIHGLIELRDGTKNLTHQDCGRRVLREEVG